jgi:hypothetical protein
MTEFAQPLDRKLTLDNPNLYLGEKIYLRAKIWAPYVGLAFIGSILVLSTYAIFFFFKDVFIAYMRKEDRSYLYKLVTLRPHIKLISYFTVIITIFWVVVLFLDWRWYIIGSGFLVFMFIYLSVFINYYLIEGNKFDYFDELIWLYGRIKKNKEQKLKKD